MEQIVITPLTPKQCAQYWDVIQPFIQMALEDEHYTADDIKGFLLKAISRAYLVTQGGEPIACVTAELVNYPHSKVVRIHTAGGKDSKEWAMPTIEKLLEEGKQNGASEIQIIGRKGWLKVLDGFKQKHITMSRAI